MFFQIVESLGELEALMERMKRLQEDREDGETTCEEMTTRFEQEKKESLFVVPGETFHSFPHSGVFFLALAFGSSIQLPKDESAAVPLLPVHSCLTGVGCIRRDLQLCTHYGVHSHILRWCSF